MQEEDEHRGLVVLTLLMLIMSGSLCVEQNSFAPPLKPNDGCFMHKGVVHVLFFTFTIPTALCVAHMVAFSPALPNTGCFVQPGSMHFLLCKFELPTGACNRQNIPLPAIKVLGEERVPAVCVHG